MLCLSMELLDLGDTLLNMFDRRHMKKGSEE